MTAPSIKEALELGCYYVEHRLEVSKRQNLRAAIADCEEALEKIRAALATLSRPKPEAREAIALADRIERAFEIAHGRLKFESRDAGYASITKAFYPIDAKLISFALRYFSVQDEAAIRAGERDIDAMIDAGIKAVDLYEISKERRVAGDCDCRPEDTANWKYADTCREAASRIEELEAEKASLFKSYHLAVTSRLEWRNRAEKAERALAKAVEAQRTLWFILRANGGFTLERSDVESYPGNDRAEIVTTRNDVDGLITLTAEILTARQFVKAQEGK